MSTAGYIWYFLEAVFILVVSLVIYFVYSLHREHKKYDFLPGPPRDSFLFGNSPSIKKVLEAGGVIDDYLVNMTNKYGNTFRFTVLNRTYVVITNPEGIKEILVTGNYPKAHRIYEKVHTIFGERLGTKCMEMETDPKLWIKKRAVLDQWFRPMSIRELAPYLNELTDVFLNKLDWYADGKKPVRMSVEYNKMILDITLKIAFGLELETVGKETHLFIEAVNTVFLGFSEIMNSPMIQYNPFKRKFCNEVRNACDYIRTFARQHMRERREVNTRKEYVREDLLSYILKIGEKMDVDEEELLDEFIDFLNAGYVTTASMLSSATFLLAKNQDCLKKLQHEIDEVLGSKAVVSHDDFGKLTYLDMVMKETFRLYPPALRIYKQNEKECQLNGYTMPPGTEYYISMYASSRCNANVKEPEKFFPERHSPESDEKITKYSIFPFSLGPRNCIAQYFAEDELKTVLVKLVQRFDFELVPGQDMGIEDIIVIRLKGGATCYLKRRMDI